MNGKLRYRTALLPIAMSALIALVVGAGAQVASATSVPMKAFYSGSFTPTSTGFSVSGTGNATTLGNTSNQGTVVMQSQPNPNCPTTGFVVTNDETVTAANGDQATLRILDAPCPVQGEPGIFDGVSTYYITGGTGRFAAASGQGRFDGRGDFTDPNNLTFTYTFNGTLSARNAG